MEERKLKRRSLGNRRAGKRGGGVKKKRVFAKEGETIDKRKVVKKKRKLL